MDFEQIIKTLKRKITSKEYSRVFANVLYRYYISQKNPDSNLENVSLIGVGKVVATNYSLVSETHPLCWNYDDLNTYHFLILRNNKIKGLFGLLIPPINNENYIECKSFQYAFPLFDTVQDGKTNAKNIFFRNIFNEQVECGAYLFDKTVPFMDLLSPKQRELNKIIVEHNENESTPLLSTLIFNFMK